MRCLARILWLLGASMAFNTDDNWDGYSGKCPSGWRDIKDLCYHIEDNEKDFHGALKECTSKMEEYYMHWEQGSRWLGPDKNLMPVELLNRLSNADMRRFGRGPYRLVPSVIDF